MKALPKKDFPVEQARRFLEPGPIVLVSTAWRGQRNLMTMGWHMVMGFAFTGRHLPVGRKPQPRVGAAAASA